MRCLFIAITPIKKVKMDMRHSQITTNRNLDTRAPREILSNFSNHSLTGAAAAVINDGKLIYSGAAGVLDADSRRLVKADSIFQVASVSKVINALGILILVQEGDIKLGDDIRDYLGSMRVPKYSTNNSKPSIRRILRHHGGVSQNGFSGYHQGINPLPTLDEIISGTGPANHPAIIFSNVPGSVYDYSGGGTTLLQKTIEVVTGESYQCWMKQEVLAPLGMTRSTFDIGPPYSLANESEIASGHDDIGEVWPGKRHNYPESAAAGLYSTAIDLSQVIKVINSGGEIDGVSFLRPDLIDKMLDSGQTGSVGLGCFLSQNGAWYHGGSNKGFLCRIAGRPNRNSGLVLLTNTDDPNGRDDINPMLDYFKELQDIYDL